MQSNNVFTRIVFFFVLSQANISKADIPGLNVGHNLKLS